MYNLIVIGIDESYTRTGISICADGKLLKVSSIDFKGCKCNSDKRKRISLILSKLLNNIVPKAKRIVVLCERIRTFTGHGSLRPNYLKSTGALIATIVDTCYDFNIRVYSVDTRSWKSKIVGTSKPEGNSEYANKMPTIKFVKKLGFDVCQGKNKNGKIKFDDDAADSACISLYGFLPKSSRNLKLEE